jgi:C-terminal processing protease CtpA/Prc
MQYFIRHSRLSHDTALAGMPYPTQGLRLTNECLVEKIWANSPADKAGLQVGDHLWSVGKAASDPQEKKDFEKALSEQGPVVVFAISPADWNKALIDQNESLSHVMHPKLRKITLNL